jgi:hypothetical protein
VLTVPSDTSPDVVIASRALMVAVTLGGVVIPRFGTRQAYSLRPDELVLLEELARREPRNLGEVLERVSGRTGSPADAFAPVLDVLRGRGLLPERTSELTLESTESLANEAPVASVTVSDDDRLVLTPFVVFRVSADGFEHLDNDGVLDAQLTAGELHATSQFRLPTTVAEAFDAHVAQAGAPALDRLELGALLDRLLATELLQPFDPENPLHSGHTQSSDQLRDAIRRKHGVVQALDREVLAHDEAECDRESRTGVVRTKVVPVVDVQDFWALPPIALGFLVAHAKAYDNGRLEDRYDFYPRWVTDAAQLEAIAAEPAIYLFSNYIWSHAVNLRLSALVKSLNPASITIHGGPDTPKYEGDCERYFRENPHVDVTVRGEGEATFAELLDALGPLSSVPPDLEALADVAGLSYRRGSSPVRTGDRDRIAELDTIPSPYLTGLFDGFGGGLAEAMILETNRGCPYGCTFCDWGSATLSRIRKFDLDRVFAELEWCAQNEIHTVSVADANYGIFARDVDIAQKVAELKAEYGYPQLFATNYAKNTVKHLRPIIEVLAEGGIITEGKVSLQSMDTETLLTIKRSNIKVEKYNDLAAEFRKAKLPLTVDLMMGLPGATAAGFRNDLQECIDREMPAIIHTTTLLANSPMNEPSYREEHGIEALPGEVVDHAGTFTKAEWDRMNLLRGVYLVCDKYGVLRQVASYVRKETGVGEVELYERLLDDALTAPGRWPTVAYTFQAAPEIMAPPCSWKLLTDEVGRYLVDVIGVPDDTALKTVLTVQHALLPAVGREFPLSLSLDHDYAAWYWAVQDAKEAAAGGDWTTQVPSLRDLPPAQFEVDDPGDVCRSKIGGSVDSLSMTLVGWELGSPVARSLMSSAPAS